MATILNPATGPVAYTHNFPAEPRFTTHPLTDGGQVVTQHGFLTRRRLLIRFANKDQVYSIVEDNETDGFVREGPVSPEYELSEAVGLYKADVMLIKYSPTA